MARARIKISNLGLYALRRDPKIRADLERRAEAIRDQCGEGYITSSMQGASRPQGRWRTTVMTGNFEAMRDNARNNTLLNAIGGSAGSQATNLVEYRTRSGRTRMVTQAQADYFNRGRS